MIDLYPLVFEPILKERIWGGTKLHTVLQKPITSSLTGESWELSTVKDDISVVANGSFKGLNLMEVIDLDPIAILGKNVFKNFGTQFPLLFKFIDAREDLSIQLHPNDELAQKRHNSFGKTEMWYVMQADEKARLIVGFKDKTTSEAYLQHVAQKTLLSILETHTVSEGDVFFLETGTIHAIGAGILIAEIQQTSDITYRVYDFDRVDANGNTRELHIDLALEAINYDTVAAKKTYSRNVNTTNSVVDCRYFTTNIIPLKGAVTLDKTGDSFTVIMVVEGEVTITCDGRMYAFKFGDTVLLPAAISTFEIAGNATVLEIYIPT